MLRILCALRQNDLLGTSVTSTLIVWLFNKLTNATESALHFDLDSTFAASFVLLMIMVISPSMIKDPSHQSESYLILDDMISRGSTPASFRKSEIQTLERLIEIWLIQQRNNTEPPIDQSGANYNPHESLPLGSQTESVTIQPDIATEFGNATNLFPGSLLSLAQMIDLNNEDVGIQEPNWLDALIWQESPGEAS
jgi:proline utilization trans-activator